LDLQTLVMVQLLAVIGMRQVGYARRRFNALARPHVHYRCPTIYTQRFTYTFIHHIYAYL